jgi:hypothetical protein
MSEAGMKTTGMTEDTELLALHHTRLASWVVQQFGKALLLATLTAFVCAIGIGMLGSLNAGIALSPFFGFFAFALYLASGNAPMPRQVDDEQPN